MDIKLFNSKLKSFKIKLIVWVVFLGVSFGLIIMGYLEEHKDIKLTYLNELILSEDNKLKNTYLDMYTEPFVFAEYEKEDSKFYIVKDNDYLYIAFMDDALYKKIISTENLEAKPYRIEGYTEEIPKDVKKLAIEAYNEAFEEEIVNEENFDSYFGTIYINTNNFYNSSEIWYLIATIVGIVSLIGIFSVANSNKKSKRVISKFTEKELISLNKELEKEDVVIFGKEGLYITKSYLIILKNYINLIKFKDIVWYYKEDIRTNGIKTNQGLILVTKDGIKHTALMLRNTKKACAKFEEIMEKLSKKLPKALVGYTEENIEKAKKLYDK